MTRTTDQGTRQAIVKALRAEADRIEQDPKYEPDAYVTGLDTLCGCFVSEARGMALEQIEDGFEDGTWHDDIDFVQWGVLVPIERAKMVEVSRPGSPDHGYWCKYEPRPADDRSPVAIGVTACPMCENEEACPPGSPCAECGHVAGREP